MRWKHQSPTNTLSTLIGMPIKGLCNDLGVIYCKHKNAKKIITIVKRMLWNDHKVCFSFGKIL